MQIRRVKLKNFRQFYGTQELEFPTTGKKNVTLIHAENGFGKTNILNAVLWSLFKQVTPKFEKPDEIVNFEAADEGETTASVVGREQTGDRTARTIFDKPEFFRFFRRLENLQIIEASVLHGGVLQHGKTSEDRLATVHLDRGRSRDEWFLGVRHEHLA